MIDTRKKWEELYVLALDRGDSATAYRCAHVLGEPDRLQTFCERQLEYARNDHFAGRAVLCAVADALEDLDRLSGVARKPSGLESAVAIRDHR